MNADWLAKYPRAAAMLQGDDDVLLYEPQSSRGREEAEAARRERVAVEPGVQPGHTIQHVVVAWPPQALLTTRFCATLLTPEAWTAAGQPCPCGQVLWSQELPRSPETEEDDIDRGDW